MRKLARMMKQFWAFIYYFFICYFVDRPKRVAFANSVLAFHDRDRFQDHFPSIEFSELFSNLQSLNLSFQDFRYHPGNASFPDLVVLAAIVQLQKPKILFEFGTGDGNTTLQLSENSDTDAMIYTLDLPSSSHKPVPIPTGREDLAGKPILKLDPGDQLFFAPREVGRKFKGSQFEKKIQQLFSDSALFDTAELRNRVDFIFVDGAHSYEYIHNDTEKALEMLSLRGIIVWHDYLVWNDVTDYLNELSKRLSLTHIKGTSLVVYKVSN